MRQLHDVLQFLDLVPMITLRRSLIGFSLGTFALLTFAYVQSRGDAGSLAGQATGNANFATSVSVPATVTMGQPIMMTVTVRNTTALNGTGYGRFSFAPPSNLTISFTGEPFCALSPITGPGTFACENVIVSANGTRQYLFAIATSDLNATNDCDKTITLNATVTEGDGNPSTAGNIVDNSASAQTKVVCGASASSVTGTDFGVALCPNDFLGAIGCNQGQYLVCPGGIIPDQSCMNTFLAQPMPNAACLGKTLAVCETGKIPTCYTIRRPGNNTNIGAPHCYGNASSSSAASVGICLNNSCGDGVVFPPEQCDHGSLRNGTDGICSVTCTLLPPSTASSSPGGGGSCQNVTPASCTDGDGGANLVVAGSVTFNGATFSDSCPTDNRVIDEYICIVTGGAFKDTQPCPIGTSCSNGACRPIVGFQMPVGANCTDTDGLDITRQGTVTQLSPPFTDAESCVSATRVREYYCRPNGTNAALSVTNVDCPTGKTCSNGACR